jgi:hypothetical protein
MRFFIAAEKVDDTFGQHHTSSTHTSQDIRVLRLLALMPCRLQVSDAARMRAHFLQ